VRPVPTSTHERDAHSGEGLMATRAEFLEGIRREVERGGAAFPASASVRPHRGMEAAEAVRRQMAERWPEAIDRFAHEFARVAGVFHRVAAWSDVPEVILGIAREKGATTLVAWHESALGFDPRPPLQTGGLSVIVAAADDLDESVRRRHREESANAQIGVTGADIALAETGTLILLSGRGRPRATSLLPDTHVAVFDRSRLVESLAQVGVLLEALHADPAGSMSGAMINFITGPSRTADIELTLTRGVHGPKDVHAIFVETP
jgi:L-lactate dehydrogenase complex protein LldG